MKLFVLVLFTCSLVLAEDPKDFGLWTSAQLKDMAANIKIDPHTNGGDNRFAKYGNHGILLGRREGDGEAI
jgi:hypothetical protein